MLASEARHESARRTPGTAEREASVAHLLASEARRDRARGHVRARQGTSVARTETPLYAFSRAIDRESLAGLGNSLKPRGRYPDRTISFKTDIGS